MSRTARIEDGAIVELLAPPEGMALEDCYHADLLAMCATVPDAAQIGWKLGADGKTWKAPTPSEAQPAVPSEIYDYQLIGQAEAEGMIKTEESDAWIGQGVLPVVVEGAIKDVVPDAAGQRKLRLFLMGSTIFPRHHERTPLLGALFGKTTDAKLDAFFVAAGQR